MKVLFISEQPPWPLDSGGNLRTHNVLRAIASEHSVTLLTHAPASGATIPAEIRDFVVIRLVSRPSLLSSVLGNAARGSVCGRSVWLRKNISPALLNATRQEVCTGNYDVVHFNMLDTAAFILDHRIPWPRCTVFDSHNCLSNYASQASTNSSSLLRRVIYAHESNALRAIEAKVCQAVAHSIACSESEADVFSQLAPGASVLAINNGADDCAPGMDLSQTMEFSLVFVGAMDYAPNAQGAVWLVETIWPLLSKSRPQAKCWIVGRNPTAQVRSLGDTSGVEVTGTVDNVMPFLDRSRVVVVPLLAGSGTRLKILSAFAANRPVVSTTIGADGLGLENGVHLSIADDPGSFSSAIDQLWNDTKLASRLATNARSIFNQKFSWQVIQEQVVALFRRMESDRDAS